MPLSALTSNSLVDVGHRFFLLVDILFIEPWRQLLSRLQCLVYIQLGLVSNIRPLQRFQLDGNSWRRVHAGRGCELRGFLVAGRVIIVREQDVVPLAQGLIKGAWGHGDERLSVVEY